MKLLDLDNISKIVIYDKDDEVEVDNRILLLRKHLKGIKYSNAGILSEIESLYPNSEKYWTEKSLKSNIVSYFSHMNYEIEKELLR